MPSVLFFAARDVEQPAYGAKRMSPLGRVSLATSKNSAAAFSLMPPVAADSSTSLPKGPFKTGCGRPAYAGH
jgi:hypothetical protein